MNEFEATIELNITVKDAQGVEIPNVKVTVKEIEIEKITIDQTIAQHEKRES